MRCLDEFLQNLERDRKGSLVSVSEAKQEDKNAKKFLSLLAQRNRVQRVTWGWYWIPVKYNDFFDFLAKDKHFKVLQKQTAASIWNGDFIHRDHSMVAVKSKGFAKAFKAFSESQGWNVSVEIRNFEEGQYRKVGKLYVESLEETIVDCLKAWAFADAFAALYDNHGTVNDEGLSTHYWERIPRTEVRVGQVLARGNYLIEQAAAGEFKALTPFRISDSFVERQIEEAVDKVVAFA